MNNELLDALTILEKEKNISKETLLEAIENSLLTACKNHFGKADNVKVVIDPDTCEYHCYQEKTVVETVEDPIEQISLQNAQMINGKYTLGDIVQVEVKSKEFGRIATQNAKRLFDANIRKDPEILEEVLRHLRTMRDTWKEVMAKTANGNNIKTKEPVA